MKILKCLALIGVLSSNAFPTKFWVDNERDAKLRFEIKTPATIEIKISKKGEAYFHDFIGPDNSLFEVQLPTGSYDITTSKGYLSPEELSINVKDNIYVDNGKPTYNKLIKLALIQNALIDGKIHAPEYITETINKIHLGYSWEDDKMIDIFCGVPCGNLKPGKYEITAVKLMGREANVSRDVSVSPSIIELKPGKNWLAFYIKPTHDPKIEVGGFDEWHLIKKSSGNERLEDLLTPPEEASYGEYLFEGTREGGVYRQKAWVLPFRNNEIKIENKVNEPLVSAQKIFNYYDGGYEIEYSKNLPVLIGDKKYDLTFKIRNCFNEGASFDFYINGKKYKIFSFSHEEMKAKAETGEATGRVGAGYRRTDKFERVKTFYKYPFKLEASLTRLIIYQTYKEELSDVSFKLYQLDIKEKNIQDYFK